MRISTWRSVTSVLVLGGALTACAQHQAWWPQGSPDLAGPASTTQALAGTWEYQEGGFAYPLTLDRSGNGTYAWKGGAFVTTQVSDRIWRGRWAQAANDREGRFVITLSHDHAEGRGRWWYTRIGENEHPQRPGGIFHVTKVGAP